MPANLNPKAKELLEKAMLENMVDEGLVEKARREVKAMKIVTQYALAEKLGIPISTAKKILRILEANGDIVLHSRTRRCWLYVAK